MFPPCWIIELLPFNNTCFWSRILECELSPAHQERLCAPNLILPGALQCLPHSPVVLTEMGQHKALLVKFHSWLRPDITLKVSISAVAGVVSNAECSNQSQYSINTLFKQKVGTLISSQICLYWLFSFKNLCPFYFSTIKWALSHLSGRLFSFSCCF